MSEEDLAMIEWLKGASYEELISIMEDVDRKIFRDGSFPE